MQAWLSELPDNFLHKWLCVRHETKSWVFLSVGILGIVTRPQDLVLRRDGLNAVFTCVAGLSWFHDDQEVTDGGRFHIEVLKISPFTLTNKLTIQQAEVGDTGTYECRTICDDEPNSATLSVLSKYS